MEQGMFVKIFKFESFPLSPSFNYSAHSDGTVRYGTVSPFYFLAIYRYRHSCSSTHLKWLIWIFMNARSRAESKICLYISKSGFFSGLVLFIKLWKLTLPVIKHPSDRRLLRFKLNTEVARYVSANSKKISYVYTYIVSKELSNYCRSVWANKNIDYIEIEEKYRAWSLFSTYSNHTYSVQSNNQLQV